MTDSGAALSASTEELFRENTVRSDRMAARVLSLVGVTMTVIAVLGLFNLYELTSTWAAILILIGGLFNISTAIFAERLNYRNQWLRSMILIGATFSSAVHFFYYPLNASFICYGPILLSARYYDPKVIRRTSRWCWSLYTVLLWGNVLLERISPAMQRIHAEQQIALWNYPQEVLLYRYIPHTIFFAITAQICMAIARNGRRLVIEQAAMTSQIARVETELKTASDIQQSSLPEKHFTGFDGRLEIGALMRPAKTVGGDFYDYFTLDRRIIFLVADVSDKGLPAAMFMMKAKNALRLLLLDGKSLPEAVDAVNRLLCQDNAEDMYITLWAAELNADSGVGSYINCGHIPPLLRHADGSVSRLDNTPDLVLGVFEDAEHSSHLLQLNAGDTLLLFTDGLTDAVNTALEAFGYGRLQQTVSELDTSAESCCERLVEKIDAFAGAAEQFDDITALSLYLSELEEPTRAALELEACTAAVENVLNCMDGLLREKHCPDHIRRNLDTVLDEICGNIADYAYPEGSGSLSVRFEAGANYLTAEVADRGVPFDPLKAEAPAPAEELQVGGLGLFFVKSLTDRLEYARIGDENRLTLTKVWS